MNQNSPELMFGLIRAIGTDADPVVAELSSLLKSARFLTEKIHLSRKLPEIRFINDILNTDTEDKRYRTYMNGGDILRSLTQRADAAAILGMMQVKEKREEWLALDHGEYRGRGYILKSLMHPIELTTLKQAYGQNFFSIAIFAPRDVRVRRLAKRIAASWGEPEELWVPAAEEFVSRDAGMVRKDDDLAKLIPSRYALDVQKTFQRADLFISATAMDDSTEAIRRFVELIFGHPFHTPTKEELGMCLAYGASIRSSSLDRRVGAAILTPSGEVVSVGSNESPRFGGGQYWPGDEPDGRTFVSGYDTSDRIRREIFSDLIRRLYRDRIWIPGKVSAADRKVLNRFLNSLNLESTIDAVLSSSTISKARVLDVIEYIREVHAEMAAITDAAKRGVPLKGCVLYCTTFPCHECARLIVSAGITRVVYIEPYPKSKVAELYEDSIGLADRHTDLGHRVRFEPFVGISPRRYFDLFSWVARKEADTAGATQDYKGAIVRWSMSTARMRETIVDVELNESGIRNQSMCLAESRFIDAFKDRLKVLDLSDRTNSVGRSTLDSAIDERRQEFDWFQGSIDQSLLRKISTLKKRRKV